MERLVRLWTDPTPIVVFRAQDDATGAECVVDDGPWVLCVAPQTTTPLVDAPTRHLTDRALTDARRPTAPPPARRPT
jgi:hypothetical protein